jgi:hypothetical protein
MLKKQLLIEYIKKAVREKIEQEKRVQANMSKSVYLIYKFPGLKDVFVNIMSPAFPRFLKEVTIVAPKPTTFKIKLLNNQEFYVYYANKGKFMVKVAGKKYPMDDLAAVERCSAAITSQLELNYNTEEVSAEKAMDDQKSADLKASLSGGGGGGFGGPQMPGPGVDPNAPDNATTDGSAPAEPIAGSDVGPGDLEEPEEEPNTTP